MAFKYNGVRYETPEKMTIAEIRAVEKYFGEPGRPRDMADFTTVEQMVSEVYIAVKRIDPRRVTLDDLVEQSYDSFERLPDEPAPEPEFVDDPLAGGDRTDGSSDVTSPEPVRS